MIRRTFIPLAVSVLALAACGDDDESAQTTRAAAPSPMPAAGDAARYCALSRELDRAGSKFFAALEADENATAGDYEAAERDMVVKFAPRFAALQAAAPAKLKTDDELLLKAQRERAGLETPETQERAVAKAESRLKAFEKREC